MDTAGVEQVDFNALGGADVVTVHDLSGTDVKRVNVDESSPAGSGTGDGQADQVIVDGTNGDDKIDVSSDANGVTASGLSAQVSIQHPETTDELAINGLAGNDSISAAGLAAARSASRLDGGAGDDTLAGGQGVETLVGGDGNDRIDGNKGNDLALMGAGDDTFVWDPGDGSDTVEGQDGDDTMLFNGAAAAEHVDLSANGNRLRFFRDVGNITMDTAGVEQVDFNALGGADVVTVHNLSGTDVKQVNVDESSPAGSGTGDGQADQVIVDGTNGDDNDHGRRQQRRDTRGRARRDGDHHRCRAGKRHPVDQRARRQRPRQRLRARRERGQVDDRRWERQRRPDRRWRRRRAHRRRRATTFWSAVPGRTTSTVGRATTSSSSNRRAERHRRLSKPALGSGGRPQGRPPLPAA